MYLYEIRNTESNSVYVGITRTSLEQRFRCHKNAAKRGVKTPLYDSIRSKSFNKFTINLVKVCTTEEELLQSEKDLIEHHRNSVKCYNILDGGAAYFPIKDWDEQKRKLRLARAGRKPALGMAHTEENKKLFSEFGKMRWDIYGRYPKDVTKHRFVDANKLFGISKTHFYRLRKLAEANDLS
jgi:group I intron endonuclease